MTRFDLASHRSHPGRLELLRVADAALDAIEPEEAMRRAVTRDGDVVRVGEAEIDLTPFDRVVILGVGKASVGMGRAAVRLLDGLPASGVVVTNAVGDAGPLEVVEGGHPVPDHRSVAGGRALLDAAADTGSRDLAVVVISGGGSALVAVPAAELSLEHLQQTNALLLRSGADVGELNTVRKHLSAVKGGRLARALNGAGATMTLILSDVVGNPLDVIASGPTVPDPTTYTDALGVLTRYGLSSRVPTQVLQHLERGADGSISDTPIGGREFDRQVVSVIADAEVAGRAAAEAAVANGWAARLVSTRLEGEARDVARALVSDAADLDVGGMLVFAGETTVTVEGDGRGGRNQELALAASIALEGREDVVVLSLGTDGIDGMSDAAGAFGDGTAVRRGHDKGLDAADHLSRNDSNPFLSAVGDTVTCGPTGTNVGDLILVAKTA